MYKILVKGDFNAIKHVFYKVIWQSRGADVTMKGLNAFLDKRGCQD